MRTIRYVGVLAVATAGAVVAFACSSFETNDSSAPAGDAASEATGPTDAAPHEEPDAGGDATSPPSCAPGGSGMTTCGPSGDESCCKSLVVEGAKMFARSYENDGGEVSGAGAFADVSTFTLDELEVTVGRFRQFRAAWQASYKPAVGSGKHTHLNGGLGLVAADNAQAFEPGWIQEYDDNLAPTDDNLAPLVGTPTCPAGTATWTPAAGSHESLPITCVNWWEAYAFCIWDGGFLPSQTEWEYAAAGGDQQRSYPWGQADPEGNRSHAVYGCYGEADPAGCADGGRGGVPATVGSVPDGAGRWGQLDLAGNVQEWNLDVFQPTYVSPCADCYDAKGEGQLYRVFRGADFGNPKEWLAPPYYAGGLPGLRDHHIGFRCARTPPAH